MAYYLAVDIGASSGRHILGSICDGKLVLEEIYRFENGMDRVDGSLVWDTRRLAAEVVNGIKKCSELGKIPQTVAVDTWGVDYVLLDKDDHPILPVYAYRDSRTDSIVQQVEEMFPNDELYRRTGIQKQNFNTIYQLYCDKISGRLDKAESFLMIPEYLYYCLTGVKMNEYTEASTSGLLNAEEKTWDKHILKTLGLPEKIFGELNLPATLVGGFTDEIREQVGFDAQVVLAPCHDTAAAVCACPLDEESMYISSGTWSLVGVELIDPITNEAAQQSNLANEGGVDYRYRFLKNIMGMWLFQNIRKNTNKVYSYDDMMHMAENSSFDELVDVNAPEFTAPESMVEAIRQKLGKPELPLADVLACVYKSLATLYAKTADELEKISGKEIKNIHIVGGGGADTYLNRLTAQLSGRHVFTGLKEATATGNILSQIMYAKGLSLKECRDLVIKSFSIKETQI